MTSCWTNNVCQFDPSQTNKILTNYFPGVASIQTNKILFTFALKLLNERIIVCSCKARLYIHDYNYLLLFFHFQFCEVIIAIANYAVHIAFSHQENKGDMLIVCQSFFLERLTSLLLTIRSS